MAKTAAETMSALLERFYVHCASTCPELADSFRPGLDDTALDDLERRCGLPLPSEVRTLYGWRDGCGSRPDDLHFLPNYYSFLPSADLTAGLDWLRTSEALGYEPTWVPLFRGNETRYLLGDCRDRAEVAPVCLWDSHVSYEDMPALPSLSAMFALWNTTFERGWWHWDPALREWQRDLSGMPREDPGLLLL